ncbi:MAG TPA: hypothetical protein H9870_09460 [Candidatus Corynebacterium avicola]|uniref:Uncharacterized protein n=1 Tax=Candidatus Corynebacterium avicola TaxID=2838527 RepID=A0A9D1UL86_9CORY|nr:hypothetical protein [Candidatus Corynebacterium avicola]
MSIGSFVNTVRTGLGTALLVNAVPHGVAAALGKPFPTPYADPPGIGFSSPLENGGWSAMNLLAGVLLIRRRPDVRRTRAEITTAVVAAVSMTGYLTWHFAVSAPEKRSQLASA